MTKRWWVLRDDTYARISQPHRPLPLIGAQRGRAGGSRVAEGHHIWPDYALPPRSRGTPASTANPDEVAPNRPDCNGPMPPRPPWVS